MKRNSIIADVKLRDLTEPIRRPCLTVDSVRNHSKYDSIINPLKYMLDEKSKLKDSISRLFSDGNLRDQKSHKRKVWIGSTKNWTQYSIVAGFSLKRGLSWSDLQKIITKPVRAILDWSAGSPPNRKTDLKYDYTDDLKSAGEMWPWKTSTLWCAGLSHEEMSWSSALLHITLQDKFCATGPFLNKKI